MFDPISCAYLQSGFGSSLEEGSLRTGDLELGDELVDEGLIVGERVPVEMICAILEDHLRLRLDLRDVVLGLALRADVVVLTDKEGHGNSLDLGNINKGALSATG